MSGAQSSYPIINTVAFIAATFYAQFCHLHFTAWAMLCIVNMNAVLYMGMCVCILKYSINLSTYLYSQLLEQSSDIMVASWIMHFNILKTVYLEKNLEECSYFISAGTIREWY